MQYICYNGFAQTRVLVEMTWSIRSSLHKLLTLLISLLLYSLEAYFVHVLVSPFDHGLVGITDSSLKVLSDQR